MLDAVGRLVLAFVATAGDASRFAMRAALELFMPPFEVRETIRQLYELGLRSAPLIAVSGMAFYNGDRFPNWRRNLFVGGMREGEMSPTGKLDRIVFNDKWEELRRESLLRDLHQRIRDVRQGPDGLLYVVTEEDDAALLRIEPIE